MGLSIYSLGERAFRLVVFQGAVMKGHLEQFLMRIYEIFSQKTCCPKGFDSKRAAEGLNSFQKLGARVEKVTPCDGQAKVQMMTLRSEELEKILNQHGAKWKKITPNGKEHPILAIIPPEAPTEKWKLLEAALLRLKWRKEKISTDTLIDKEVIITCDHADLIDDNAWHQKLFLHSNSASVNFVMLTRRAGFYLGCKQNVCFYDPRGSWGCSGIASEAGYYNDIDAVYQSIQSKYKPKNIWLTGVCAGGPPAAYLKAKLHNKKINLIIENGFVDLKRDFIGQRGWLERKFAGCFWNGLKAKDIKKNKPIETGFNIEKLWENLRLTSEGKVVVVSVKNDQRLPKSVSSRLVSTAKRVNQCVQKVRFQSKEADPHFDRYFKYEASTRKVLQSIFTP